MSSSHAAPADAWILPTLDGLLSPEQSTELRAVRGERFWEGAVRRGWTTDDAIVTALAARFRMRIADLAVVQPQALSAVPESLARRYRIVPLAISETTVDIATADPQDLDCDRALAFALGRSVRASLASPAQIARRLDELYRPAHVIEKILDEGFAGVGELETISEVRTDEFELSLGKATDQPIIRLVDRIIAKAIQQRASDIHLEAAERGVTVRYRIDGVLKDDSTIPRALGLPLVARVKIMAQLDIADRLRPQDGRARVAVGGARIDLRVSTLPASLGEKVVIRILDARATVLALDGLGLSPDEEERVGALLRAREGLLLVTGPTGSGKTTTLYSMIRTIQQRGVNIVTVEDPVEYRLQGIVQVNVNEKTGMTFPAALRSILRQDPDVILVGEVRDKETAQIAVQASLTGHLVLTTLHTIDAASSVARLADIGIEPYKAATALKGILAQRLVRRLCPSCRQLAAEPVPARLRKYFAAGTPLYRPGGCDACANTGFRGRLAILEVLVPDAELERKIAANATAERIAAAARDAGMRTLWDSGIQHVRDGVTTIDELLRVLEAPNDDDRAVAFSVPVHAAPPPAPPVAEETPAPRSAGEERTASARGTLPGGLPRRTLHDVPAPPLFDSSEFDVLDDDTRPAGPRSVLLVEDEAPLRSVLRDLLQRDGFTVHEAADGVEALHEIDRAAPDVVVLDLNLPRLDGYGVLSHLRARAATRDLPVIVLTAKGDEESEVRVFEYGATEYVTKPFRSRALIARLNTILRRR